ncbi:MAG: hypothetical protein ACOCUL_02600, partial [Bacteroidota bacterium]
MDIKSIVSKKIADFRDVNGTFLTREAKSFKFATDKKHAKQIITEVFIQSDKTIKKFQWLPEYDEIADWMVDTKGKGL